MRYRFVLHAADEHGHLPGHNPNVMRDKQHDLHARLDSQRGCYIRHGGYDLGHRLVVAHPGEYPRRDVHQHNHADYFIGTVKGNALRGVLHRHLQHECL